MGTRVNAVARHSPTSQAVLLEVAVRLTEAEQVEVVVHVAVEIEDVEDLLVVTDGIVGVEDHQPVLFLAPANDVALAEVGVGGVPHRLARRDPIVREGSRKRRRARLDDAVVGDWAGEIGPLAVAGAVHPIDVPDGANGLDGLLAVEDLAGVSIHDGVVLVFVVRHGEEELPPQRQSTLEREPHEAGLDVSAEGTSL